MSSSWINTQLCSQSNRVQSLPEPFPEEAPLEEATSTASAGDEVIAGPMCASLESLAATARPRGPAYVPESESGPLRRGQRGLRVEVAQHLLAMAGADLQEDGLFGSKTEASVRAFQARNHLKVDGKIGPKTQESLEARNRGLDLEVLESARPMARGATNEVAGRLDHLLSSPGFKTLRIRQQLAVLEAFDRWPDGALQAELVRLAATPGLKGLNNVLTKAALETFGHLSQQPERKGTLIKLFELPQFPKLSVLEQSQLLGQLALGTPKSQLSPEAMTALSLATYEPGH